MRQSESPRQSTVADPEPSPPVHLSAKAAEVVKQAMREEGAEGQALRVGVMGGGCSGLQYRLDFTANPQTDDFIFEERGVRLVVDPYSAAHLAGTVIDWVEDPSGTGFRFDNPNIVRACSCSSPSAL